MNAIAQAALDDLPQGTRVEVIGPSAQCGTALADGTPTVGITTAAACKAAAAAVGLTYQKAVDAHDRPAGCWKDPNTRVYFNAQASPTSPWSRPRALCTLGATSGEEEDATVAVITHALDYPAQASPAPQKFDAGISCLARSECSPVTSRAACKAAADSLWAPYTAIHDGHNTRQRPAGCFVYTTTMMLEYNADLTTPFARSDMQHICLCKETTKVQATSTTAIATTSAPAATTIVATLVEGGKKCKKHKWFNTKDATLAACQARVQADPYCGEYFQWLKDGNCGCAPVSEVCPAHTRRRSGADLYKVSAAVLPPGACVDVKVGSSRGSNSMVAITLLQPGMEVSATPKNVQLSWWRDTFATTVVGSTVTVRRTDSTNGWGQSLVLEACVPR